MLGHNAQKSLGKDLRYSDSSRASDLCRVAQFDSVGTVYPTRSTEQSMRTGQTHSSVFRGASRPREADPWSRVGHERGETE
jgi:hypothetical protein